MRALIALLLLAMWVAPNAAAQHVRAPAPKTTARRPVPAWPNVSKENQERALKLLQRAEAGAASLDAASRIVALTDLARSYEKGSRTKSVELLETAFSAARELEEQESGGGPSMQLIYNLLRQFANIAPERLDARVFDLPPKSRAMAADLLVPYYIDHKQFDRAYNLVMRVGQEGHMPYNTAIKLMQSLRDRPELLRSLFVTSLASFENDSANQWVGFNDFAEMIVLFHDQVPDEVVVQAIDTVLSQAKESDKQMGKIDVSISSSKAAIHLDSAYEYRLFELLPVLKKVDSSRAELLLKDNLDVASELAKYPNGTKPLHSHDKDSSTITMQMNLDPSFQGDWPSLAERHRLATIEADATMHPHDALANAALLSPRMALDAYMAIARQNVTKDSSSARSALSKAQDLLEQQPLDHRIIYVQRIAAVYQQLGDRESAKKTLEKGMGMTADIYRRESIGDNTNPAPVAFWLSTNAWRFLIATAQKLDAHWAPSLLNNIPDDKIAVFSVISMANSIVGVPTEGYVAATDPKEGVIGLYPFASRDGK